uniref:AIG1-type G domain-containing protein n=1 Tax=Tetraodon nigroviridis TaxID=99883 RepID=H3CKV0_TETNG
ACSPAMSGHTARSPYGSWGPEVRLILVGNIGCGKTTSADTILGQPSHVSGGRSRSCQRRNGTFDHRSLVLVEAPRWYWSGGKMEESVRKETQRAMTLVAPGPHAILLLVPVNQFTEMEGQVPAELKEVFGEEVLGHTMVLLTCGDYLMGSKEEEYLQREDPGLRQIIAQCGGRYHFINNRQQQNREQVQQLLEKIKFSFILKGKEFMEMLFLSQKRSCTISFPLASSASSSSSSFPPAASDTSVTSELRLVLLGRSGSGKSTAGNIILGQEVFRTLPDSLTAVTQDSEKKKKVVEGRRVAVVDTADWFNSEKTPEEVRAQISACVTLSSPGPHVFLFCVPLDQPAKSELQALAALEFVFGREAVQKHTVVLFTHADQLKASEKDDGVEAYIAAQRTDLLKLVERCRDRFHVLEWGSDGPEQSNVSELLEKVDQTVQEAGGQYYSCPAFKEAEDRVRQRQVEIVRERKRNNLEE